MASNFDGAVEMLNIMQLNFARAILKYNSLLLPVKHFDIDIFVFSSLTFITEERKCFI